MPDQQDLIRCLKFGGHNSVPFRDNHTRVLSHLPHLPHGSEEFSVPRPPEYLLNPPGSSLGKLTAAGQGIFYPDPASPARTISLEYLLMQRMVPLGTLSLKPLSNSLDAKRVDAWNLKGSPDQSGIVRRGIEDRIVSKALY